jgi:hypothetical protein
MIFKNICFYFQSVTKTKKAALKKSQACCKTHAVYHVFCGTECSIMKLMHEFIFARNSNKMY